MKLSAKINALKLQKNKNAKQSNVLKSEQKNIGNFSWYLEQVRKNVLNAKCLLSSDNDFLAASDKYLEVLSNLAITLDKNASAKNILLEELKRATFAFMASAYDASILAKLPTLVICEDYYYRLIYFYRLIYGKS